MSGGADRVVKVDHVARARSPGWCDGSFRRCTAVWSRHSTRQEVVADRRSVAAGRSVVFRFGTWAHAVPQVESRVAGAYGEIGNTVARSRYHRRGCDRPRTADVRAHAYVCCRCLAAIECRRRVYGTAGVVRVPGEF